MKLDVKALAIASGILWGGMILLVGAIATIRGPQDGSLYAKELLLLLASIYPGYDGAPSWGSTLIGTLYGAADGLIGGGLLAWIYNRLATGARPSA